MAAIHKHGGEDRMGGAGGDLEGHAVIAHSLRTMFTQGSAFTGNLAILVIEEIIDGILFHRSILSRMNLTTNRWLLLLQNRCSQILRRCAHPKVSRYR